MTRVCLAIPSTFPPAAGSAGVMIGRSRVVKCGRDQTGGHATSVMRGEGLERFIELGPGGPRLICTGIDRHRAPGLHSGL